MAERAQRPSGYMMSHHMKRIQPVMIIFCVVALFLAGINDAAAEQRRAKRVQKGEKGGKTVVEYVTFSDNLKGYDVFPWETSKIDEFTVAYRTAMGAGVYEDWIRTLSGTGNKNRLVKAMKSRYVLVSCCKPHACDMSQIVVLFEPTIKRCWAIYAHDGVFDYPGSPDESIKNLLRILLVDEYKDIYAASRQ